MEERVKPKTNEALPKKESLNLLGEVRRLLAALGRPLFYVLLGVGVGCGGIAWGVGKIVLWIGKGVGRGIREAAKLGRNWWGAREKRVRAEKKIRERWVGKLWITREIKRGRRWKEKRWRLPKVWVATKWAAVVVLVGTFFVAVGLTWLYLVILADLPRPGRLATRSQAVSSSIYDRNGELLYKVFRDENRTLVKLEEIPASVRQATVAIEDAEFYAHPGFSWRGIFRAIWDYVRFGEMSGGSTITQQLVKNALLTPERSLVRKLKEVILAIQVESRYSKDEILEMYLNEVGYGGTAYGIEAAAETYFGKKVGDLSLAEIALLAGLPVSPTAYSPFGAHPELASERQRQVLERMVTEGFITKEEMEKAEAEELSFAPQRTDIRAPHFVMYVKQLLVEKYGERMVEEGGLEVTTSLDLNLQNKVQEVVTKEVGGLARLNISNGAALVTKPGTGEVLAMVGSVDYFDLSKDGNFNVTTALRQPGSAIKPVTYGLALENGYTAGSILSDTPISFAVAGQPVYSPRNYDGRFHGPIPLRIALASSYNVPAVKVLASLGVTRMIEKGEKMGITTWKERNRFGLSLTLGGGEVKMADMAVVYGVLANGGRKVNLHPILAVKDYKGRILESYNCSEVKAKGLTAERASEGGNLARAAENDCSGEQVIEAGVAFILTSILSDNWARSPAFGASSQLYIPSYPEVTVKTGTTNNLRDNWTIGYSQEWLTVTWVGNNDNRPMAWVASGVTGASPIWRKMMDELLKGNGSKAWAIPANVVQVDICGAAGTLPCEGCATRKEWFLVGTEPKIHCRLKLPEGKEEEREERMWRELVERERNR